MFRKGFARIVAYVQLYLHIAWRLLFDRREYHMPVVLRYEVDNQQVIHFVACDCGKEFQIEAKPELMNYAYWVLEHYVWASRYLKKQRG